MADCRAWLNGAPCALPIAKEAKKVEKIKASNNIDQNVVINTKNMPRRRMSMAGSMLFSVNNQTQETGFDYLEKVLRPNLIKSFKSATLAIEPTSIKDNTDPEKENNTEEQESNDSNDANNPIGNNTGNVTNSAQSAQSNKIIILSDVLLPFKASIGVNGVNRCNDANATPGTSGLSTQPSLKLNIQNNFDPFRRVPNPPFSLTARKRSQSLDERQQLWKSALATITEHEPEEKSGNDATADEKSEPNGEEDTENPKIQEQKEQPEQQYKCNIRDFYFY